MAQGKPKPRKGSGMLAWRSRQKTGKIMKPSTFSKISKESPGGEKAAGAAYWKAAHKKYKESRGIPER
jgi:hypothetical protein